MISEISDRNILINLQWELWNQFYMRYSDQNQFLRASITSKLIISVDWLNWIISGALISFTEFDK